MSQYQEQTVREPSGWAIGGVAFAGIVMVMIGIFQFFEGLAALLDNGFFVVPAGYAFNITVTGWGWIHLIVGVLVALAGFFLFARSAVAGWVAIIMAALAAVVNFFYIPYYPFWSLLIIALCVYVIWAVSRDVLTS